MKDTLCNQTWYRKEDFFRITRKEKIREYINRYDYLKYFHINYLYQKYHKTERPITNCENVFVNYVTETV